MRNRGTVLARLGRHAEARQCLENVLALQPGSAEAHCNLANVLRDSGAPAEALERFRRAIDLDPGLIEARIGLALALRDLGRDDEAREHSRQLLHDRPDSAAARIFEGTQCLDRDDTQGAAAAFREAIALQSSNADAHYQLGNVLMRQLRSREAIDCFQRALAADPSHPRARWALVMAQIPPLCDEVGEVAKSRSNFTRMLVELDKWFDAARSVDGDKAVGSMQPYYLAYQATGNRDLLARYGALCARLMAPWQKEHVPAIEMRATGPIRVGIASAQLRQHSVWNAIIKGWVKHLDKRRFELYLFNLGAKSDAETEQARQWAHRLEGGRRELRQWATSIVGCGLDVLIYPEIGMDPLTAKLASMRLARVQAATWGHPETTGLPTIDHYLSAEALEPPNASANYTEQLVALPHLGVCYEPLAPTAVVPDLDRARPAAGRAAAVVSGHTFQVLAAARQGLDRDLPSRRSVPAGFLPAEGWRSEPINWSSGWSDDSHEAGLRFADCVTFVPTLDRARFFGLMQRAHLHAGHAGVLGLQHRDPGGRMRPSRRGPRRRVHARPTCQRNPAADGHGCARRDDGRGLCRAGGRAGARRGAPPQAARRNDRAARRAVRRSRARACARTFPRIGGKSWSRCKLRAVAPAFAIGTMDTKPLSRIVLGLTGGIAAYKAAELTRLIVKADIAVDVCMTAAACRFVAPLTLQALSGRPVLTDLWQSGADNGMGHINLSRDADAIVVAPASADFLAKIANGHADDLLSTLTLARDCTLFVAPAMNRQMWSNAANQRNVARLIADGVVVLGPGSGDQACGETGEGRMLEPQEIFDAVIAWGQPKVLAGRRVLLTAGPTFEAIDPVRGITNSSSGKMGYALAQAAAEAGPLVTLVSGPTSLRRRRALRVSTSPVPPRWRPPSTRAWTASMPSSRSLRSPITRLSRQPKPRSRRAARQ